MAAKSTVLVIGSLAVALLAEDRECLTTLQDSLRATRLGLEVFSHVGFPISATDIFQLQDSHAEVVIIDIPTQNAAKAARAAQEAHSGQAARAVKAQKAPTRQDSP